MVKIIEKRYKNKELKSTTPTIFKKNSDATLKNNKQVRKKKEKKVPLSVDNNLMENTDKNE